MIDVTLVAQGGDLPSCVKYRLLRLAIFKTRGKTTHFLKCKSRCSLLCGSSIASFFEFSEDLHVRAGAKIVTFFLFKKTKENLFFIY